MGIGKKVFLTIYTFNISFCAESNWSRSCSCSTVIWAASISATFLFISDMQLQLQEAFES